MHMPRVRVVAPSLGVLAGALLLGGCMTAKLDENRVMQTHIAAGEGVVILAKPKVDGLAAEDEFLDCVGNQLAADAKIKVASNDQFQDSLFPWFEPSIAPQRAEGLARLLGKPKVAQRVADSGVRYVIWVDGSTRKTDSGGSFSCAVGPGGGGCLGFGWWERESAYEASVWDLQTAKSTGEVSTSVTGTSALVGVIVPVPIIARVQAAACDRMAAQLADFLQGHDAAQAAVAP